MIILMYLNMLTVIIRKLGGGCKNVWILHASVFRNGNTSCKGFVCEPARQILARGHYLLVTYKAVVVSNGEDLSPHISQAIYFSRTNGNTSSGRESL